jgi:hypothetical protein
MATVKYLNEEQSAEARILEKREDQALRDYMQRTGAKSAEALVMGKKPTSDVDAD